MSIQAYRPCRVSSSSWHEINGLKIHVRRWHNEGAPKVLLLHGWLDASAGFQFAVDHFAHKWDVFAPDWRGMGMSEHQASAYYDRFIMLSDLHELMERISPNNPLHVVGHSLGGMMAAQYAGTLPERVKTLVLAEAFGMPAFDRQQAHAKLRRFLREMASPPHFSVKTSYEDFAQSLIRRNRMLTFDKALFLAHALLTDASGCLKHCADARHLMVRPLPYDQAWAELFWAEIRAPILCVQGEALPHNTYLKSILDCLEDRYAALGNPRVVTLSESGHMVQWEAPQAFALAVETFWMEHA